MSSYATEVAADNPLVWLKFDETSGGSAADSGSDGTAWPYSTGVNFSNPSLVFDAGASVNASGATDTTGGVARRTGMPSGFNPALYGFSVEIWVKAFDFTNPHYLSCVGQVADPFAIVLLTVPAAFFGFDAIVFGPATVPAPTSSKAHHYVLTFSASGDIKVYQDAVLINSTTADTSSGGWPTGGLAVGEITNTGYEAYNSAAVTELDHFALYSGVLSSTRIAVHYNAGKPLAEADGVSSATVVVPSARANGVAALQIINGMAVAVGRSTMFANGGNPTIFNGVSSMAVHIPGRIVSNGRAGGTSGFFIMHTASARSNGRASAGCLGVLLQATQTRERVITLVTTDAPTPAIVDGQPLLPTAWAQLNSTAILAEGGGHIRAIKDPNPAPDPYTGGWYYPPPPVSTGGVSAGAARWTVDDLPSPGGGYYWLGDPSTADGTQHIPAGARQWNANASTGGAPAWHSAYPFKPSVTAVDRPLQGGGVVHHPKGVNFNSQFIEHMWLDFGQAQAMPFSWVIACMIASWPSASYTHYILDAGINPAIRGLHLNASQCSQPRALNDGLGYRNLIAACPDHMVMKSADGTSGIIRAGGAMQLKPAMYFGVFNGSSSMLGVYRQAGNIVSHGAIDGGRDHRNYVLGRSYGVLSQAQASHIIVFEIRYFDAALTENDLALQYGQLSSTYQFGRY